MKAYRIVIVIIVLVAVAFFLIHKTSPKKEGSQHGENAILIQQSPEIPIVTQNFIDPKSGFSFEYPSTWSVNSNNKQYTVCLNQKGDSLCTIGINIVVAPDESHREGVLSNEDLISAFKKRYSTETIKSEQRIVNGLHILEYSSSKETQAFIETPTYDYNFIASSAGGTKKDLDSILSTVQSKWK